MRRLVCSFFLALALVALPGIIAASSVEINFEPSTYTPGSVNNQDGWSSTGSAGSGCAVYDHEVVTNVGAPASFGLQSLRMSNAVTSGCFGDQTFSKSLADDAGETTATSGGLSGGVRQARFEGQWSFISTTPNAEQPGLSVVVSPDRGDGSRMSWVQMQDSASGININFFDVQGTGNPANFVGPTPVAAGLDRTMPHTVKIVVDFFDGPSNDVVQVFVDGTLRLTGTTWENYYGFDAEALPEAGPRTVDSLLFRTGGAAAPATLGKGFLIDNVSIASGAILIGPPTSVEQCKKDGWANFNNPAFRNQGQCVSYITSQRPN